MAISLAAWLTSDQLSFNFENLGVVSRPTPPATHHWVLERAFDTNFPDKKQFGAMLLADSMENPSVLEMSKTWLHLEGYDFDDGMHVQCLLYRCR